MANNEPASGSANENIEDAVPMQALPLLYITAGNNYDVGYQMGFTFKGWIKEYFSASKQFGELMKFYKTVKGREAYESYLKASTDCYPDIIEEIKGLAEGADQPFERLFLQCLESEIVFFHNKGIWGYEDTLKQEDKIIEGVAGCTDVIINSPEERIIGHNEDWDDDVDKFVYMIHVTLTKNLQSPDVPEPEEIQKKLRLRDEQFVSYVFPGILPGLAFSMNEYMVFTINSLVPANVNVGSVPVDVLLRALMACKNVDECVDLMKNEPIGCSYGININIAMIDGKHMWSLEVYPDGEGNTEVSLKEIEHVKDENKPCHYFHQNHYKHLEDTDELNGLEGSKIREETCNETTAPRTEDDVIAILGDTEHPKEQIYRVPGVHLYSKSVKTTATGLFNIKEKKLDVYRCNPTLTSKPCLSIPFFSCPE